MIPSAHRSVGNAITLLLICSVVLVVLFVLFRDVILAAFGATENNLPMPSIISILLSSASLLYRDKRP